MCLLPFRLWNRFRTCWAESVAICLAMCEGGTVSKKQNGVMFFGICIVCIIFIALLPSDTKSTLFKQQPASPRSPDSPVRHSLPIAELQPLENFKFSQMTKFSRLLLDTISTWNLHHPHGSFRGDGERRRLLCSSNIEPCDWMASDGKFDTAR